MTERADYTAMGEELGEKLIELAKETGVDVKEEGAALAKELKEWGLVIAETRYRIETADSEEEAESYEEDLGYAKMAADNILGMGLIEANTQLKHMLKEAMSITLEYGIKIGLTVVKAFIPIPSLG